MSKAWRLFATFIIICQWLSMDARADKMTATDCGVHSLFVLLRMEGHPASLESIQNALPDRNPNGYSMAELAAAAKTFGLVLDGVRFSRNDLPLESSAIVFLKDRQGGHFTVLRPVGTTGTLVQIIDPPRVPWIADYDRLLSNKSWTDRILIVRSSWKRRFSMVFQVSLPCLALAIAVVGRRWIRIILENRKKGATNFSMP